MNEIICKIELMPPAQCETGAGCVYAVGGYCFNPNKRTAGLVLLIGDARRTMEEFEDFRPDIAHQFADVDNAGSSVTSGFFTLFGAAPDLAATEQDLALEITFDDGSSSRIEIGRVAFIPPLSPPTEVPVAKLAICLATWNPEPKAFTRQIDSLIAQDFADWVCIVNDDGSAAAIFEKIRKVCARDPRFHLFRNPHNVGFYRNFESAMRRVPAGTEFVALCDQDDYWNTDKLSACLAAFETETQLVYCDMRIVHESGTVVASSYWMRRRNQYRDLDVLMTANTVTGAASVFRGGLLTRLLPFPQRIGDAFHDHWIACCALAGGGIEYVDRPLYDYIQHGGNVIGHATFDGLPTLAVRIRQLAAAVAAPWKMRRRVAAFRTMLLYIVFNEYRRLRLFAETMRRRFDLTPELQASLSPFLAPDPWGLALLTRFFSPRFSRDTTGHAELRMGLGLATRRLNRRYVRGRAQGMVGRIRLAAPAARLRATEDAERARRAAADVVANRVASASYIGVADKIAPLTLAIDRAAPRRVNLLLPEISFENFFGGYIGKFNLARKIAEAGFEVRMVIVDWCDVRPGNWRALVNRYRGLEAFFDYIEVAYCYDRGSPLTVNPDDAFIASTWWTAHIAADAMRQLSRHAGEPETRPFTYLIQEHEPFTFPMGTLYALADQSYAFPHHAVFSTALLEEYFREHGIGAHAPGRPGAAGALHFENAILKFKVDRGDLSTRRGRKLLFYARPEGHAARNMFEIGMLALEKAIAAGVFGAEPWVFHGIGTPHGDIEFEAGGTLRMQGKFSLDEYQALLPQYDVGLSLMYTPHPSLVPLEMAAAGMLSVTNTCLNKTAAKLAAISSNLIAAEPTIDGVAAALAQAVRGAGDIDARVRGSQVNWASSWDAAFNDEFMQRISGWLNPSSRPRA